MRRSVAADRGFMGGEYNHCAAGAASYSSSNKNFAGTHHSRVTRTFRLLTKRRYFIGGRWILEMVTLEPGIPTLRRGRPWPV